MIDKVCCLEPESDFIILGDFNINSITWKTDPKNIAPLVYEGRIANELVQTMHITNMKQTNFIRNANGRILDLVLTTIDQFDLYPCTEISKIDPHHPVFEVILPNRVPQLLTAKKSIKLNFFKANYDLIVRDLDMVNWEETLEFNEVDTQLDIFYRIVRSIISLHTPKIYPKNRSYPIWFTRKLITLIQDKNHYRKKFKKGGLTIYQELYALKRRLVKAELKVCEKIYVANIENKIKTNPKVFFAYSKALHKTNRFPNVMSLNENTSNSPEVIANLFATHFESVYAPNDPSDLIPNLACDCRTHTPIVEEDIRRIIISLDINKNNSTDGIPNIFYKNALVGILKPITIIFNTSIMHCTFPTYWKQSFLTPIYKSGEKSHITNYRPVSITCAISKILEKLILNRIRMATGDQIVTQQHGFSPCKSTVTNLGEYSNFLAKNIINGGQVDAIYTDFSKAFDRVDHVILIQKLLHCNIKKCTTAWIYSFLCDRTQIVCINGTKSRAIIPSSSVPQGCILSPYLFSLFINDLPPMLRCNSLLFADDLKIFQPIKTINDCIMLQKDLDTLHTWCTINKLDLNVSKCMVMSFSYRRERKFQLYNYRIDRSPLNRTSVIRDLGILFDHKLSFVPHIESIISKAAKMLGFICRIMHRFSNQNTYQLLYFTYVRPLLEYGSQIWNPYYQTHTEALELVQRKFTRMYAFKFGIERGTYITRLNAMKLMSLANRRLLMDELFLYKLINRKIESTLIDSLNFHVPSRDTRTRNTFYIPFVSSNLEFFSLSLRLQRQHNDNFMQINLLEQSVERTRKKIIEILSTNNEHL